ncbi:Enzymatic polyprotein [Abeliophyllum distichum]|uniref:Enzymatic polyprotein n=1 Tax=Abeliophyllum distichum TaxID=126358 RepID=A0ABD1TZW3_9LAMI
MKTSSFNIVEPSKSHGSSVGILKSSQPPLIPSHSNVLSAVAKSNGGKNSMIQMHLQKQSNHGLINKTFLVRTDCKALKDVLQKDVKNLVSKQIFARWQAILSCFDFSIEFIKGENNSLPDLLTREFLQDKDIKKPTGEQRKDP